LSKSEEFSERRVLAALESNQFRLYYQPQIDQLTGRIVGAEALLRWLDPHTGLQVPGHFLASLESTGLILPVGEWALRQASEDCLRWQRRGLPRLRMGINVSPLQIEQHVQNPKAFDTFALRSCCDLYLEIDGRAIGAAHHTALQALHALQFEGVNIAVQGFGFDDSLRDRLGSLPVDVLKVDRSFVQRMVFENDAADSVASIIALAQVFRLGLVAEGVETTEQLDLLCELGCRQVQGFVYSAALPATRFEGLLEATMCTPGWAGQRLTH